MATGHIVVSVELFAPFGQPHMQAPVRSQPARLPTASERIAWAAGHQCQFSSFIPSAALRPIAPIGSGGSSGAGPGG
jgi:hypothetical protein